MTIRHMNRQTKHDWKRYLPLHFVVGEDIWNIFSSHGHVHLAAVLPVRYKFFLPSMDGFAVNVTPASQPMQDSLLKVEKRYQCPN